IRGSGKASSGEGPPRSGGNGGRAYDPHVRRVRWAAGCEQPRPARGGRRRRLGGAELSVGRVRFLFVRPIPSIRRRPPRRGRRNDAARDRFVALVGKNREVQIEIARTLVEIDECGHFVVDGSASIGEFGERYGMSASETRRLLAMGRAMQAFQELEQKVR